MILPVSLSLRDNLPCRREILQLLSKGEASSKLSTLLITTFSAGQLYSFVTLLFQDVEWRKNNFDLLQTLKAEQPELPIPQWRRFASRSG